MSISKHGNRAHSARGVPIRHVLIRHQNRAYSARGACSFGIKTVPIRHGLYIMNQTIILEPNQRCAKNAHPIINQTITETKFGTPSPIDTKPNTANPQSPNESISSTSHAGVRPAETTNA